ncbi:50S ribosomal protein L21 [candidate division KSB1 bacterium]|nr:50S ribosomal protein L21 [candidate division KSB1 bacterium]TDI88390.1 MAG: 50S ribosomal protein L21 [Caldithrix sp.]TDI97801.1 MAG: 50S ribosomal protein L21 [Caldithrix sp.]
MYAIVDIAGKQFKVSKKDNILVPKVAAEVGKSVEFDKVLLVSDNGKVLVGQPTLKGATVKAKVLSFERGKKVIVYKKKRRKGFEVKKGHRQDYTKLEIQSIVASMSKKEPEEAK